MELYISIAEFDKDYVRYITGMDKDLNKVSLMQVQTYGPFNTLIDTYMSRAGSLLLALCIEIGGIRAKGEGKGKDS